MAMIQCPECKRLVSEKAPACPKCGIQITSEIVYQYKIDHPKLGETMNCPVCKRIIHKQSTVCKHCKQDLSIEGMQKYRIDHPPFFESIKCPNCKKRINNKSEVCNHCQIAIPAAEMKHQKERAPNEWLWGCLFAIILFLIFMTFSIYSYKKPSVPIPKLAAHRVLYIVEDDTPVSLKYFVSLMVSKDIKRQELKALLLHYMDKKVKTKHSKKLILFVYAYTDSLRYERGEQWVGMLQLKESQNSTPIITYDEVNLIDGTLKKSDIAGVNDPLRKKMFYDVSNYDYEVSLIMEDKYPMTVIEQITFMKNDSNRDKYLAEEESTRNELIHYYSKKHSLKQAEFDALYIEGNQKNWTQKSAKESERIKLIYRSFMQ